MQAPEGQLLSLDMRPSLVPRPVVGHYEVLGPCLDRQAEPRCLKQVRGERSARLESGPEVCWPSCRIGVDSLNLEHLFTVIFRLFGCNSVSLVL